MLADTTVVFSREFARGVLLVIYYGGNWKIWVTHESRPLNEHSVARKQPTNGLHQRAQHEH